MLDVPDVDVTVDLVLTTTLDLCDNSHQNFNANILFHVFLSGHDSILSNLKAHLRRCIIHEATKGWMLHIVVALWRVSTVAISVLRLSLRWRGRAELGHC